MNERLHKNKMNVLLVVYILICIVILLVRIAPNGRYSVKRDSYGVTQTSQYDLEDGSVLETEFLAGDDFISGIGFYYLSNGHTYTNDEKILVEFYLGNETTRVAYSEILLSEQTDKTEIFVPFENNEMKGKRIRVRISYQDSDKTANKYPSMGASDKASQQMKVRLNGALQETTLVFGSYYRVKFVPSIKVYLDFAVMTLVGIFIWAMLKFRIIAMGGESKQRLKRWNPKKRICFQTVKNIHICKGIIVGYFILLLGVIVLLEYTYHYSIKNEAYAETKESIYSSNELQKKVTLKAEDELTQNFTVKNENLAGVGLMISEGSFLEGKDHIFVRLTKPGEDVAIFENVYSLLEAQEESGQKEYIQLVFPKVIQDSENEKYRISINLMEDFEGELKVTLATEDGTKVTSGSVQRGEHSFNVALDTFHYHNLFLKQLYKIFCCMLVVFISAGYFLCFLLRKNYYRLFIPIVLSLGMIYCLLLPVYMTPDEPSHIDTAYRISNYILGYGDPDGTSAMYKRTSDINSQPPITITVETYREMSDELLTKCTDENLKVTYGRNNLNNAKAVFYLPAALGITVGRTIGAGKLLTYTIARLFTLLTTTLLMYWGICLLPFGKMLFFMIALLPMTLQQAMSVSYDPIIIGISYVFIGYCMKWAYTDAEIRLFDVSVVAILSIMLASCKGGVYLPISFLMFLVPIKRRGWSKNTILLLICMGLLFLLFFLSSNPNIFFHLGGEPGAASSGETLYSLSYFLQQPKELIYLLENTFYVQGDTWFGLTIGSNLGWTKIHVQWILVIAFFLLLLLSSIAEQKEKQYILTGDRIWILILSFGSFGLILMAMLVSWTPESSSVITGVQGRYFLPFIGLLLLTLRNRNLRWIKTKENYLIFSGCVINLFVVSQVFLSMF